MCDQVKFSSENNSCEAKQSISPVGPSCLRNSDRSKKGGITRNVSFPEDDSQIVTGILEPENPWKSVTDITNEDLISMYISSCKKHGTYPIPTVLDQLSKLELKIERNKLFSLKGITLNATICETLEDILKHIQFQQINLESTALDEEACCLEELEARNTTLNEVSMPILGRALKVGSQLQVLKLENCGLNGRSLIILASALKVNSNLKELYLGENNLGMNDANQLGSMLKCNTTLQLLDISHNDIKDAGFNYIIDGIIDQGFGLSVLMVWNNQLTKNIAYTLVRLLGECTGLETLNVGQNVLNDEFLRIIKDPLISNKNLLRLGLQSTALTNEAAFIISDILNSNSLIQRVDLRDNNIQTTGLSALLECLKENSSLIRLDLDKLPRKSAFTENSASNYKALVEEIRKKCAENERNIMERKNESDNCSSEEEDSVKELSAKYRNLQLSVVDSRKISLTCESLEFRPPENLISNSNFLGEPKKNGRLRSPAPSPIPSPVSSPSPVRSRFQVSKVVEGQNSPPLYNPIGSGNKTSSRFKVTVVEPETKPLSDSNISDDSNEITLTINYPMNSEKTYPGKENKNEDSRNKCRNEEITKSRNSQSDQSKKDEKIISIKIDSAPAKNKDTSSNPITEKIRKLSWVGPILQAPSAAMESAKIPTNLEKLLGLFQNPFVRSSNKTDEVIKSASSEPILTESHRDSSKTVSMNEDVETTLPSSQEKSDDKLSFGAIDLPADENSSANEFSKLSENIIKKLSEQIEFKEKKLFGDASTATNSRSDKGTENLTGKSDSEFGVSESKAFPATWPQKLSPNYLPSPSKSSPNILEATAFVLLQGHVPSDLTTK
ncbi:protein phosphatase 1 regulatory subunit 37 isoform X2 [Planococcus citri]|uniref:protein phosphatase 1 regulatory subunit 37 isoform X2 n=1 Tax=Planococcus citri TaxID=170843 RepID=UPI0031F8D8CC